MWSWWFTRTSTGARLLEAHPVIGPGSWARGLNVASPWGSHDFKTDDSRVDPDKLKEASRQRACTLVQCWNDIPVYQGVILDRPYNPGTKTVTIRHRDYRHLLSERYPFGATSYWADGTETMPGVLSIASLTLRSAAARFIAAGIVGPTPNYPLPLVLPSTMESGTHTQDYPNENFRTVEQLLTEVQSMDGGPDVDFAPRRAPSGAFDAVVRMGTPAELRERVIEWNLDATDCPAKVTGLRDDASSQITGVFGVGQGSGPHRFVGGTPGAPTADIPAADKVVTFPDAPSREAASSFAREHLAAFKDPTSEPGISINVDVVDPTTLVLGSRITLYNTLDKWMPQGYTHYRLLGFTGGTGKTLHLEVQRERAA